MNVNRVDWCKCGKPEQECRHESTGTNAGVPVRADKHIIYASKPWAWSVMKQYLQGEADEKQVSVGIHGGAEMWFS